MNPDLSQSTAPLTKKQFNDTYWFSPLQMITVSNPKAEDYRFMVEMRHFIIKAGATESFPGTVANVYLSQMTRILAQDDDRMELLSDINLMKFYYDSLIADVTSLIQEDRSVPDYMRNVPKHTIDTNTNETPPWQQNAPVAPPVAPEAPVAPPMPPKPKKPEAGTKEFEYNGLKFKAVTDKEGVTTFFKNDVEIDEPSYAKAASML